jgi:hypothetical protein
MIDSGDLISRNTLQVIDFKRWTQAAFCFFGTIFGVGPIASLIPHWTTLSWFQEKSGKIFQTLIIWCFHVYSYWLYWVSLLVFHQRLRDSEQQKQNHYYARYGPIFWHDGRREAVT